MPDDRALWPAYVSGGKLYPTTSTTTTLGTEKPSLAVSSSLPGSYRLSRLSHSSQRVHEHAVTSASDIKHVRPGVGRNDRGDSIGRTASSPIDFCSVKIVSGISSRSKSEGAWNPHSPLVTSRSSYSPPTEDDSDFEMDELSTLSCTFNHSQRKNGGWDGLEMEMEM